MIRILHTSDWHIGHELYGHDRLDDHRAMLEAIRRIVTEQQPDAMIVSGDIYHTATPSNAAMTLFNRAMTSIRRACPTMRIIVTAGNHDSPSRLEVNRAVWSELGADMIGSLARLDDGEADFDSHIIELRSADGELQCLVAALPHIYSGSFPSTASPDASREERRLAFMTALNHVIDRHRAERPDTPVVMTGHLAIKGCDDSAHDLCGGMDYVELDDIPVDYDYLALGHIHCRQTFTRGNALAHYCGTPLGISFDEKPPHSVTMVEIESRGTKPRFTEITLPERHPLTTWPARRTDAVDFKTALEKLASWPADEYLRIRVAITDAAPPHAIERAHHAASQGHGRFCVFDWVRPESDTGPTSADGAIADIDTFKALTPLEVAKRFYSARIGSPMPPEFETMLDEITSSLS